MQFQIRLRHLGGLVFGLSVLLTIIIISFYITTSAAMANDSCTYEGGCVAHRVLPIQTIVGLITSSVLAIVGLLLMIYESALVAPAVADKVSSVHDAMLSILTEDERNLVHILEAQPGIPQNTLRIKADLSKSKLSMLLQNLEKRGLVKKEPHGKTNRIYLKS